MNETKTLFIGDVQQTIDDFLLQEGSLKAIKGFQRSWELPWEYFRDQHGCVTILDALIEHYFFQVVEHGSHRSYKVTDRSKLGARQAYWCSFWNRKVDSDGFNKVERLSYEGFQYTLKHFGWWCDPDRDAHYTGGELYNHVQKVGVGYREEEKKLGPQGPMLVYLTACQVAEWRKQLQLMRQANKALRESNDRFGRNLSRSSCFYVTDIPKEDDERMVIKRLANHARHHLSEWAVGRQSDALRHWK